MSDNVLTEVLFWQQVTTDAQRTLLVNPDLESRVKGWIDARGLSGMFTARAMPMVRPTEVLIVDEHAMNAAAAKPIRDLGLYPPGHPFRL